MCGQARFDLCDDESARQSVQRHPAGQKADPFVIWTGDAVDTNLMPIVRGARTLYRDIAASNVRQCRVRIVPDTNITALLHRLRMPRFKGCETV